MMDRLQETYDDMDSPKQSITTSMPQFFGWIGVICAGLITAAICWNAAAVVQLKADVAVLVARPEGVSRAEYLRDTARYDREMQEMRERIGHR
jgi:hypothetical protein